MAGIKLEGGANTPGSPNVDSTFNLKVNLPAVLAQAGYVALVVENDDGVASGTRQVSPLHSSAGGRLSVGVDTAILNEVFPGLALNSSVWSAPVTTMTVAVAGGFCTLNNALSTASGAVAQVRTYRHFPCYMSYPALQEIDIQFASLPLANNECIWGWCLMAGTAAPTDGVYWILNTTGEFRCVLNFNGVINQSPAMNFATLVGINTTKHFGAEIMDDEINFTISGVPVQKMLLPAAGASPTMAMNLPIALRCQNTAITSAAQQIKISATVFSQGDMQSTKPWQHILCGAGGHSSQGQTGGTMGTTANYPNSANPVAAVPTNTTAALGSGLGGQFWETDTLAVTTDGIISSYQIPVGAAALPGKTMYVTRVRVESHIQTALVGGPYVAQWSLAYGHTAVSLATTETATTKAPRRIPLGFQQVAAAAAAATVVGNPIDIELTAPIVVYPGEFIQVVKKKVGTAPTGGVIAHSIFISGYSE